MFDYIGIGLSRGMGISARATPGEESPALQASIVDDEVWEEYVAQLSSGSPATKRSQVILRFDAKNLKSAH